MKRRSKVSGQRLKAQRPNASKFKHRSASKLTRTTPSVASEQGEIVRLTRELNEAREQQTATSVVLGVISSSGGELGPVFHAMLENATRLCEAKFGVLWRLDGEAFHTAATQGLPPALAKYLKRGPHWPGPETGLGRLLQTRACVQVLDASEDRAYAERDPMRTAAVELGGVRTFLVVPMLKEGAIVGAMSIIRQEVRPFTDKQIELVKNFAAQAVIAIENARLLNELRQRTTDLTERSADLTEALEQQTATSEVLQVISGSAGDVEPAFAAMLEKAVRICDATFGNIYRWDGEALHLVATRNTPPAFAEARSRLTLRPGSTSLIGRMLATKLWCTLPMLQQLKPTNNAFPRPLLPLKLAVFGPF
jgi:transcriptional regulator with GAF, ATPase, and Fis domain